MSTGHIARPNAPTATSTVMSRALSTRIDGRMPISVKLRALAQRRQIVVCAVCFLAAVPQV